jgi:hypothetical protein
VVVVELPLETFTPSTDFVVSVAGSVAMPLVVAVGATVDVSDTDVTMKTSFVREILGEVDEVWDEPVVMEAPAVATTPATVLEVEGVLEELPEDTLTLSVEVEKDATSPSAVRDVFATVEAEEVPTWASAGVVSVAEAVETGPEATSPFTVREVTVEVTTVVRTLADAPIVTVVTIVSVTTAPVVARRTAVVTDDVPFVVRMLLLAVEELAVTSTREVLNAIAPGKGSLGVIAIKIDSDVV